MDIEEDSDRCLKQHDSLQEEVEDNHKGNIDDDPSCNQEPKSQLSTCSFAKLSSDSEITMLQRVVVQEDDDDKNDSIKQALKLKQLRKRRMISKLTKVTDQHKQQLLVPQQFTQVIPRLFMTPPTDDCFAFGEIVLEGNFKRDPFNIEKTYSWSYFKRGDCVTYSKPLDCILVDMTRRIDTEENFEYVAQRYLNTPDQEIHRLGEYLQTYLTQTKQHLEFVKENRICLQSQSVQSQLKQLSQDYYEKSLKWMHEQASSENNLFMFYFCELDISTMDQNYTHCGFSIQLLELLGLDATAASALILRKGRLEFVDGYSRLARLLIRLNWIINRSTLRNVEIFHDIMTFDDFQVPVKCTVKIPEFDCLTPQNFSQFYLFFGQFLMNSSVFRLIQFEVNPKTIEYIRKHRAEKAMTTQDRLKNAFSDFEYQLISEVFIDKHYRHSSEGVQGSKDDNGDDGDLEQKKILLENPAQIQKQHNQCGYRKIS